MVSRLSGDVRTCYSFVVPYPNLDHQIKQTLEAKEIHLVNSS